MKKFSVMGTLEFVVSNSVQAISEEKALIGAYEQVNDFNVVVKKVTVELESGEVMELDVHDIDVKWDDVHEV